jgi:hypothetical protein
MSRNTSRDNRKPEPDPAAAGSARQRQCLMCSRQFASAWPGERICSTCKNKSAWRIGVQLPSRPSGLGR